MALFQGEDLIDITTPDGRTLKLPRSVVPASLVPQQIAPAPPTAPAGFTDETVYNVAEPEIPSVTGGELPEATPAPAIETPAPPVEYHLATIDTDALAKREAAREKQAEAQARAQARYLASPQGRQAAVGAQTQEAFDAQKQAALNTADVEAATQDVLAGAVAQRNADIEKMRAAQAAEAQQMFAAEDAKRNEIEGTRKKIASTKIDRQLDHPIIAAIGAALAGIGAGMKGEKVETLDILLRLIDRKVAAQMEDLDQMGKVYGMQRDELAALKDKTTRKLELHHTLLAGEIDKAKRYYDEIVAKSSSEKTRAMAKEQAAVLDRMAAEAATTALRWGLEYDQKDRHQRQQIGLGYAQLGEQRRHNMVGESLTREGMYLDYQKALAQTRASGDQARYKAELEMIKDNEERGIRGRDGEFLMSKEGREKLQRATDLETQAKQIESDAEIGVGGIPTPEVLQEAKARAASLREQAAILRGNARLYNVLRHRDKTQAGKFSDSYAAAQAVLTQIDDIKALYNSPDGGRSLFFTDAGRAKLQAAFNALAPTLKEAWQLGAWDKGSAGLVEKIIGGDPSAWMTVVTKMEDPDAFMKRLDVVADNLETGVRQQVIKNAGDPGEDLFGRKAALGNTPSGRASASISRGRTPIEAEKAATPSTAGKVRDIVYSWGGLLGEPQYKVNQREATEASGSLKYPSLGRDQEPGFDALLQSYKSGNAKDGELLVAQVANAAKDRPDLAVGLAHALREHAPDLYAQARAAMPKGSPADEQLSLEEKSQIGVAQIPTPMLVEQVRMSVGRDGVVDQEGLADLARRAIAGDADAKRGLADINMRRKYPGSVFAGGR